MFNKSSTKVAGKKVADLQASYLFFPLDSTPRRSEIAGAISFHCRTLQHLSSTKLAGKKIRRSNVYPDRDLVVASERVHVGDEDEDEDDDEYSNDKRKEKKLNFILRLPSNQQHRSGLNSSLNSGFYYSDSNADDDNS
ncbi:hypothetical protein NE237_018970 [Protea cynaroides]|uniref:Uncharacterized protein n=1 Tax=Protea cynaroides TaxID=273540 RepID=A0A9Q0KAW3_9MAGN|nr:hypothetical protein NE237_018970 [Protea cynaroides]